MTLMRDAAMVRNILGIVSGVIAAFATVAVVEFVGGLLFPQAAPVDWVEQVVVDEWVAAIPLGAKLLIVFGWLLGALVGGFVAGWTAGRGAIGWVPAALVATAGIANITMIPHPRWMALAAVLAPIAGGWIGIRLARARI